MQSTHSVVGQEYLHMSEVSGIKQRGLASKHAGRGLHDGVGEGSKNLNVDRIWSDISEPSERLIKNM